MSLDTVLDTPGSVGEETLLWDSEGELQGVRLGTSPEGAWVVPCSAAGERGLPRLLLRHLPGKTEASPPMCRLLTLHCSCGWWEGGWEMKQVKSAASSGIRAW